MSLFELGKIRSKSLTSPPPSQITFEITRKCNLKCTYCYPHRKDLKGISHPDIDPLFIYNMKDEISKANVITFSGFGEPLLNKEIFNFIDFIRKNNDHCEISVPTNGTYFIPPEQIKILSENKVGILVSLDSTIQEIQDITRPNTSVDYIMENIKYISKELDMYDYKRIVVGSVITKHTKLYDLTKFVIDSGCNGHFIIDLKKEPNESFYNNNAIISKEDLINIKEQIIYVYNTLVRNRNFLLFGSILFKYEGMNDLYKKINIQNKKCLDPWLYTNILVNGDVTSCARTSCRQIYGNLNDDSFMNIWNSKKVQKFRNKMEREECKKCIENNLFNTWYRCS